MGERREKKEAHAEMRRRGEKATENGLSSPLNNSYSNLPPGWRCLRLGEIGTIITGSTPSTKHEEFYGGDCNLISPADLDAGKYINTSHKKLTRTGLAQCRALPKDSVLVGCIGNVGKIGMVADDRSATNQQINAIVVSPENDPHFVYYGIQANRQRLEQSADKTTLPILNKTNFQNFEIPVPPLSTQREIAAILGQVQKAIEAQARLLALTAELKRTLLHRLFTQGLHGEPQKQTDIGPVPESWEVVPLGAFAKVGNGSTPKRDNQAYWQDGHIPWLNSARIHDRFIKEPDQFVTDLAVKECHLPRVKANSLLIAITGQGKTLGNSALVAFETCINQHLAYAQFTTPTVLPAFVLWYMQTRYEHLRSISQAGGSTKGALTCGYLKTYPIPVPSLDEQKDIVAVFSAIEAREKFYQSKHATLSDLFRALLHELMTAKTRIHEITTVVLDCRTPV